MKTIKTYTDGSLACDLLQEAGFEHTRFRLFVGDKSIANLRLDPTLAEELFEIVRIGANHNRIKELIVESAVGVNSLLDIIAPEDKGLDNEQE